MSFLFRADLHCHSTFSDGSLTPTQLIERAKEKGLKGISITDHDTVSAYEEATAAAKKQGILLGIGAEFSTVHQGVSVHVLAYDIDLNSKPLLELCEGHIIRREQRNAKILGKLARLGMHITPEELAHFGKVVLGRAHIAQIMVQKGYVQTIGEAFQRFIGDAKPCFDPGEPFSTQETLDVIHGAHGKAFVAHPHLLPTGSFLRKLLELPFDGLECYYGRSLPAQEKRFIKMAEERGLLISGGSDFHGDVRPNASLGSSWVGEEAFYKIFSHGLSRTS